MKYYLIHNSDGDTFVQEFSKEKALKEIEDASWDGERQVEVLDSIANECTSSWGDKILIIKGEIVTLQKKEIVTKYDLP